LTTEERLYLHAARVGDYGLVREILDCADHWQSQQSTSSADLQHQQQPADGINVNCIDYMGRNALHLAVDSENVECIELLLDRLSWECQEEVVETRRLDALTHGLSLKSSRSRVLGMLQSATVRQTSDYNPVSHFIPEGRLRFFGYVARADPQQDYLRVIGASL